MTTCIDHVNHVEGSRGLRLLGSPKSCNIKELGDSTLKFIVLRPRSFLSSFTIWRGGTIIIIVGIVSEDDPCEEQETRLMGSPSDN